MSDQLSLLGYVDYVFWPKTGLDPNKVIQNAGFVIRCEKPKRQIRCFGMVPQIKIGDYFELTGNFDESKYHSFQVKTLVRYDGNQPGALSLMIHLFGKKTAVKIVNGLKLTPMETMNLFKEHQDRFIHQVTAIKGIGEKTINKAYLKYENQMAVETIFSRFSKYGMTLTAALKIYTEWGDHAVKHIDEDPYSLIEIDGIGFHLADKIAISYYGIRPDSTKRVEAGIMMLMRDLCNFGHSFIHIQKSRIKGLPCLIDSATQLLSLDESILKEKIADLVKEKKLIQDVYCFERILYLPAMNKCEKSIAAIIKSHIGSTKAKTEDVEHLLKKYESEHEITFADKQEEAVKTSVMNKLSIISGPPGSGKTTIIDAICSILTAIDPNIRIMMGAPTGKAAKRIAESTGREASTIHRMLKYNPFCEQFEFNEGNPLPADVLIIDEFSMMDILLTGHFLKAVSKKASLIIVGDHNQLPSVGPGKVLEDLLSVDLIPKTVLDQIYRQSDGSTVLPRAFKIRNEEMPDLSESDDFCFHELEKPEEIQQSLLDCYLKRINEYGIENVCVLTPMNKGPLGVDELNELIQAKINPGSGSREIVYGKKTFRVNDIVLQIKNENKFGVYNGMTGKIIKIELEKDGYDEDVIKVDYGDCICDYTRDRFDKIKLGYVLTVHKSQGSEYASVLLIMDKAHKGMMRKRLIFTAWTRVKKKLDIFGQKTMVKYCIKNSNEPPRNSKLRLFLKQ